MSNATVWKFVLQPYPIQDISIPAGAKLLRASEQYEKPCIWFLCDPDAPLKPRRIAICGTGSSCPDESEGTYVGTCSLQDGALQLHVFECKE